MAGLPIDLSLQEDQPKAVGSLYRWSGSEPDPVLVSDDGVWRITDL